MDDQPSFPLHEAAREGNAMIIRNLLAEDRTACLKNDLDGRTALAWAISMNQDDAAREILDVAKTLRKFDIDQVDESGWTVVHIAASVGNLSIIKMLVPLDASLTAQTNGGQTPMHFATSKQHIDVVQYLIEQKAGVRTKDKQGQSPLHRAAAVGSLPIAKALIEANAAINATDNASWTALHHAAAEGHGDVAVLLLQSGAELQRQDSDGSTPLDVAADDKVRDYIKAAAAAAESH